MAIPYSTALFARPSSFSSVAGSFYEFGTIGKSLYIRNADTREIHTYTAPSRFRYDRTLLINAGERVYRRNQRIVWFAALLTSRKPTPTTPAAMPCEGFGMAHWNLPTDKQNTPATVYAAGKHLCVHCAAAYERSMAIMAQREAAAKTPTLTYTKLAEAA